MSILFIFTVLLLIISLINNFFLFNNSIKINNKNSQYIDNHYIPDNIGYTTYTIFYNRHKFPKVCYKKNINDNNAFSEVIFDDHIDDLLKKHYDKLYIIKNNSNVNNIKLNEEQAKSISIISN